MAGDTVESLLVESQRIPKRLPVQMDEKMLENAEGNPTIEALLNILEFTRATDDAFEYVSFALEDSHDNDVTIAQRIDYLTQLAAQVETVTGDREYITDEFGSVAEACYKFEDELINASKSIQDLEPKVEKLENIEELLDLKIRIANEEAAKALDQVKKDMA